MKRRLLDYLACPKCAGDLQLGIAAAEDDEIMEGALHCAKCQQAYRIRRGVPRFAEQIGATEKKTADAFGYEWTQFPELADRYRQQFLDWIRPVTPDFFKGKLVLEGGCGKGRHTAVVAGCGARDVVAIDLSHAVDAAFANTRNLANAHIVQGDLTQPPFKRIFDHAFSVGVLHHLPEPERGFRALVSRLRPGGAISAWVYGREGNGWIVHVVTPVRERVTSRLPHRLLDVIATILTAPLFLATRLIYRPLQGRGLPYGPYLSYIAPFPFREQRHIVFDHLVAPVAYYLRRGEFAAWFQRAGLVDVRIEHHNANSWRGFARLPGAA
jgi:SAM-dependent methyltransferase